MARSGRLHTAVLGAYQVDQEGSLATFSTSGPKTGRIGGQMDLVAGKQTPIVMMEHRDSRDNPKLVRACTFPLSGRACVDVVVTDLAILRRTGSGWSVEPVADGFSPREVVGLSDLSPELVRPAP